MATQTPSLGLYSPYQGTDTLFADPEWERVALQVWRDSLLLALKNAAEWEGPESFDPFNVETLTRGQGRAVVVLDSAGHLAQAYCFLPIYAIHVPLANRRGHAFRNGYADMFKSMARFFRELSADSPLHIEWDSRFQVDPEYGINVRPDPIHRKGEFPKRDVLSLDQMRRYPLLCLQFIDVESTESLARYVLGGGFGAMDQRQLDDLEACLVGLQVVGVHQIDLSPEHPLLQSYYPLPGHDLNIRGLEVGGRLVAINKSAGKLMVNAVAYALMQPGSFAEHMVAK